MGEENWTGKTSNLNFVKHIAHLCILLFGLTPVYRTGIQTPKQPVGWIQSGTGCFLRLNEKWMIVSNVLTNGFDNDCRCCIRYDHLCKTRETVKELAQPFPFKLYSLYSNFFTAYFRVYWILTTTYVPKTKPYHDLHSTTMSTCGKELQSDPFLKNIC